MGALRVQQSADAQVSFVYLSSYCPFRLFPETINGDHRRLLSANIVHHISLGTELTGQCLIVEHKDDWAYIVNEKVQFEDALINR